MSRARIDTVVDRSLNGTPLVTVVATITGDPLVTARDLIERGAVWLDRYRVQAPDQFVHAGSRLVVHFPPSGAYDALTIGSDDIVWEDKWLLALNKQPGWYANYTPWDVRGTMPWALAAFLREGDGTDVPIHFAHQLDRDTSGVLLVSKDPAINATLYQRFVNGAMHKTYLALASGTIERDSFEVETGHGRGRHGLFRVYPLDQIGTELPFGAGRIRRMHTRFDVLDRSDPATLVRATPITGRTHQIRLHLQHIGHPIVGDARYGGLLNLHGLPITHHLLHAASLAFEHPVTRQPIAIDAPLPVLWRAALDRIGISTSVVDQ